MGAYAIVDGRAGYGLTVRDAYRAAWRALRLSRHDPADLLRKIALLNSQLDYANDLAVTFIHEIAENAQKNAESAKRRRARYATAIRAHRAEMTRRLRDCRRSLLDALAQRNAVASRITRMQAMVTEARAKSPELEHELRDLTTDNIEQIMERLLALAARAAEYHRRATAAEARAAELHAGQQSLLAAARAAGFEYTVSDGAMAMSEVV
jgi:chromosome segregation ATPase